MAVPYSRTRLDRALITRGEDAILRRRVGTSAVFVEITVRIQFRGYRAEELAGGIQQGDSLAILSPTQILAAGAAWPGASGGVQMPRANDGLTVQGRLRNVQSASIIYEGGEPVRIELQVVVSAVRPSAAQRGYGSRWQKASKTFLARGTNRYCACGCGQPATVVDHREPHRGDMRKFWDTSNWQGLAKACHDGMKQRIERSGYSDRLDAKGLPTDPNHPFNRPEPE